jgi:hypothetical protein
MTCTYHEMPTDVAQLGIENLAEQLLGSYPLDIRAPGQSSLKCLI